VPLLPAARSRSKAPARPMGRFDRGLAANVIPVLVAVAIIGYLVGIHRTPASTLHAAAAKPRIASGASILLEYPRGWQPTAAAAPIPGLAMSHSLALAPVGAAGQAGLLSGQLLAGEPGPLPGSLLARLHGLPHSEVVDLVNAQAYRYDELRVEGYARALELYVVPSAGESPVVLACYAATQSSPYLSECEQIVARITPSGQSPYDLSPDTGYAKRLDALIGVLDKERISLLSASPGRVAPSAAASLATALAERFSKAAASLQALQAPPVADPVQAALSGAFTRTSEAYDSLAAATSQSSTRYDAAQGQLDEAESAVDMALESYALLGYNRA